MRIRFGFVPTVLIALSSLVYTSAALAQTDWIAVDSGARDDVQLIVDQTGVAAPLGTWPLPLAELARILDAVPEAARQRPAIAAAMRRLGALRDRSMQRGWRGAVGVAGGDPARLRGQGDTLREHGELSVNEIYATTRWTADLALTTAPSASDGQDTRLDGSHLTAQFGNWMFSANKISRLWGPSAESSLILSDNARPMPALSLDRASAVAFDNRFAHWLGPWSFSSFIALMDNHRADVNRPLFWGLRASAHPLPGLDIALTRTIEMCGQGRRCSPKIFWNALVGKDNVGVGGNVSAADQPGNQMGGWDVRLRSPWSRLPIALYEQQIGEDAKNHRPTSRLAQHGIESWWSFDSGASLRVFFEYVDTVCGANSPQPIFHCSYRNSVFFDEGYRYLGRVIGHTADSDSLLRVAGLRFTDAAGRVWGTRYRTGTLNRDGGNEPYNSVSTGASDYRSAELSLRGKARGLDYQLQLGDERQTPRGGAADHSLFGFVSLQHNFR